MIRQEHPFREGTKTNLEKMKDQYASCQRETVFYQIDGTSYQVVRHCPDKRKLSEILSQLTVNRADKESGIR